MAHAHAQAHSDARLLPEAGSPRCPICHQVLPEHLTTEEIQSRLREREEEAAKAQEARIRAALEKELEPKTNQAVAEALAQQREALDKLIADAVNQEKAEGFEERQKFQKKVDELQRQLDKKTSNELGEGAEIDLYQELRTAFEDDRITRVKKGEPGADIRHEVVHNGEPVGRILYDSKNHGRWLTSFVEKLKKDQLADDADHAVLSTSVLPKGERQLAIREDVIVASPARVVVLVKLLRQHMVRVHRMRLSAEQRDDKTKALYEFIVSERYAELVGQFDRIAKNLLELDAKEVTAHNLVWKKRGRLLKDAQKSHADLANEIDLIVAGDQS